MDDCVVPVEDPFLSLPIPAPGVVLVRLVEVGIGPECGQERRLVIRASPEPSVADPCPFGDRLEVAHTVLDRPREAEELVGHAVAAGIGPGRDHLAPLGIVERVVEPRDRSRRVSERRVGRDVLDPLPVDVDLAAVADALQILVPGERLGCPRAALEHLVHCSSRRRFCQTDPSSRRRQRSSVPAAPARGKWHARPGEVLGAPSARASPNGLPSESLQIAQRPPDGSRSRQAP